MCMYGYVCMHVSRLTTSEPLGGLRERPLDGLRALGPGPHAARPSPVLVYLMAASIWITVV